MLRLLVFCVLGICLLTACTSSDDKNNLEITNLDRPLVEELNDYYISNKAPLQPTAFVKLPIGSIQPKDWLLQVLKLQKEGMTGNLSEISPWLGKEDNAWLDSDGEGKNGWEEMPYWLKGYSDLAYILKDSSMLAETKVWIDGVLNSQREDGYFGPEENRADDSPDLWSNMVMLWVLQSYYDHSHDEEVIPFMEKYFKWQKELPDSLLLEDYWGNSRGGDNLYSIYWLYNHTKDEWLLDLADKIHRNTADWGQSNDLPNWHNVNITQGFREPATYYMQSKDSADLQATYDNFDVVRENYGHVPGGLFGADENAREEYTDPHQGVETCGMVEQMNSDEMLLQFTGDPFWGDNLEDVAFNTYPAALTSDMKALRYFTAPNMVTSDPTNHSPGIENEGPFFMMNPLSNRCCQHNHTQGWPYYAENLWMASQDNGLAAVLYGGSSVKAKVGDGQDVSLKEKTHYPFSEAIEFTVHMDDDEVDFPLYLRIPDWTAKASIKVNGEEQSVSPQRNSYVRIENKWKDGDKVVLNLPKGLQLTKWEENKNSVSVDYGPLTFSLKIPTEIHKENPKKEANLVHDAKYNPGVDTDKWPAYTISPKEDWNYGLILDGGTNLADQFNVTHKSWPEDDYPFTLDSVPIAIEAKGKQIPSWGMDENELVDTLPKSPVQVDTKSEKLTLVPMGAARLRISAFPTVEKN